MVATLAEVVIRRRPRFGTLRASCSFQGAIFLWDVGSGKNTATLKAHGVRGVAALAFTPDGKVLASAGVADGEIKLWDPATGENTGTAKVNDKMVRLGAFSRPAPL